MPALCTAGGAEAAAEALAALRAGQQPMGAALARLRALRVPVPALEAAALRETCPGLDGIERDPRHIKRVLPNSRLQQVSFRCGRADSSAFG